MEVIRYRLNRKDGKIYAEKDNELIVQNPYLECIILWHSQPTYGQPFNHIPAQHWVQLCFLDKLGNWCYALINDGSTNALYPWRSYVKLVTSRRSLLSVITTISLEQGTDSEFSWYNYVFTGKPGKPGLEQQVQKIIDRTNLSFVDETIPLFFQGDRRYLTDEKINEAPF